MSAFTNSTIMVDYAKLHSAELIRQAHIANGGGYISQRSSSLSSWRLAQMASIKSVIRKCIGSFDSRGEHTFKSEAKSILQIGLNNG